MAAPSHSSPLTLQPPTPQRRQYRVLSPGDRPLRRDEILVGCFYRMIFAFPTEIDEVSPDHRLFTDSPPQLKISQMADRSQSTGLGYSDDAHLRIGLVMRTTTDTVLVLLCSSSPPERKCNGGEHRWIPFEPTNLVSRQPPITVNTDPTSIFSSYRTDKPSYMCFTHVIELTPVTQGHHELPPTAPGNARILTLVGFESPNYVVRCTNMLEIEATHLDYWRGVRYDSTGNKSIMGVRADTDDHENYRQGQAGEINEDGSGGTWWGDDVAKGERGAEGGAEDSEEGDDADIGGGGGEESGNGEKGRLKGPYNDSWGEDIVKGKIHKAECLSDVEWKPPSIIAGFNPSKAWYKQGAGEDEKYEEPAWSGGEGEDVTESDDDDDGPMEEVSWVHVKVPTEAYFLSLTLNTVCA